MTHKFRRRVALASLGMALMLTACDDDVTGPDLQPPTNVTVEVTGPNSATVTFNAVSGATGYIVERAQGVGAFELVGEVTSPTLQNAGLQPQTQYRFRVAAVRGADRSDFSSVVTVTTPASGQKVATISGSITQNRTLFADTLYTLRGYVRVSNGATLTIQPGTTIQGDYDVIASSLFIERGAKLIAEGTPQAPIVFTSSRPVGERRPGDWGGIVILGNGIINRTAPVILEGTENFPQPINYAGGTDNDDDSGSLRYVRIEFAGHEVATNAELNSLTLAAVGRQTDISYVQVLAGLDDSFEWFGGAVDAKYLVSYESGDDHFDASEGFVGRVQYGIAFQSRQLLPRPGAGSVSSDPQGIENDGCSGQNCTNGGDSTPYTTPIFANMTLIGAGSAWSTSGGEVGMMIRRGAGGHYVNSVVARYNRAAISLRDTQTETRLDDGLLSVRNLLLAENAQVFQPAAGTTHQFSVDAAANGITTAAGSTASLFSSLPADPTSASQFDWTPAPDSEARAGGLTTFTGDLATRAGTFVTPTAYRGAADPAGPRWWEGWTNYAVD